VEPVEQEVGLLFVQTATGGTLEVTFCHTTMPDGSVRGC
jgi:hypothetical protein